MKCAHWLCLMLTGVLLASVPASWADDPIGRMSLGASGGMSFYALGDVNDRIEGDGNDFLLQKGWTLLDPLNFGWSFWADFKIQLPLGEMEIPIPLTGARLPLDLFVGGGYGVSSGMSGGADYNELIEIEAAQEAFHLRLLYAIPYRLAENMRFFLAGGPLFIQEQKVTATHTHRSVAGGSSVGIVERTEEVTYKGDGSGWQLGLATEYMVQDRMTIVLDLAYRWAKVDYASWDPADGLAIADTDPVPTGDVTSLERLRREDSYIFRGFFDWETTEQIERNAAGDLDAYGPYVGQLVHLSPDELGIDLSGLQIHVGFRFYFL
ncbi:MAG: hypothetical protein KAY24_02215 [Candidatus Eisenbacteria sp.]|nr:hypothetical protein [Candidatus Eisenbacteria bacterium]